MRQIPNGRWAKLVMRLTTSTDVRDTYYHDGSLFVCNLTSVSERFSTRSDLPSEF